MQVRSRVTFSLIELRERVCVLQMQQSDRPEGETMLNKGGKGAESPLAEPAGVVAQYIEGAAVGVRRTAERQKTQEGGYTSQKEGSRQPQDKKQRSSGDLGEGG
jgi:hypothetical protein